MNDRTASLYQAAEGIPVKYLMSEKGWQVWWYFWGQGLNALDFDIFCYS